MNLTVTFRPGASLTVAPPANTGAALTTNLPTTAGTMAVRLLASGGDCLVGIDDAPSMQLASGIPEVFLITGATTIQSISASTAATSLNITALSR